MTTTVEPIKTEKQVHRNMPNQVQVMRDPMKVSVFERILREIAARPSLTIGSVASVLFAVTLLLIQYTGSQGHPPLAALVCGFLTICSLCVWTLISASRVKPW